MTQLGEEHRARPFDGGWKAPPGQARAPFGHGIGAGGMVAIRMPRRAPGHGIDAFMPLHVGGQARRTMAVGMMHRLPNTQAPLDTTNRHRRVQNPRNHDADQKKRNQMPKHALRSTEKATEPDPLRSTLEPECRQSV
ncbi:hypothetical protein [Pararhodospirillum oryzae]|uniref:Uncharacterized protein n=1 Tax=Pararhodospirillum oryzae TaxID=478448 RepID=A0A512H7N5_9PROT|nr:hypothetical protein [Pararhodospirillum oryzae]GEO81451.1 hypothetical protein ROR02_15820 [Pararhodospirillum oryzae]